MKTRQLKEMILIVALVTTSNVLTQAMAEENTKPLELQKIMRDMGKEMQAVTAGISREDWMQVEISATRIADHPKPPMNERMRIKAFLGKEMSEFKSADMKTHAAARALATLTKKQDGEAIISAFSMLQKSCFSCHKNYREKLRDHFYK